MYVELASAKLDRKMEREWGRPVPADNKYEEWFGFYHIDDETRFWSYTPQTQTWRVKSETDKRHFIGDFSDEDRKKIEEDMAVLAWCPPADPEDPTIPAQTLPFVHEGWLYAWYFFPELKRWHIAPVGKR